MGIKHFFDVVINTVSGDIGDDLTDNEVAEVLTQLLDENTTEINVGKIRCNKQEFDGISIKREEYNDD